MADELTMNDYAKNTIRRHSEPLEPLPTGEAAVLKQLPGIRAVLFDVYGTMFISASGEVGTADTGGHAAAFETALCAAEIDADCSGTEAVARLRAGIEESHAWSRAEGIEYPEVDIVRVWESVLGSFAAGGHSEIEVITTSALERLAINYEVRTNPVWPMPGLAECLSTLRDSELMLGIISNAQSFTPNLFPALLDADADGLGFHAELQFYSFQYGQAKPGRFLYELAAQKLATLGVEPQAVLYVGNDMLNDVTAAAGVGFRTALFAGDARSLRWREDDERVEGVKPDVVLTHLDQIAEVTGN